MRPLIMKTKLSFTKVFLALSALVAVPCFAGQSVGNGSEPMRLLFTNAQNEAARHLSKTLECSFAPGAPAEVKDWIMRHKEALLEDVTNSQHRWVNNQEQTTCAWTTLQPQ